MKKLHGKACAHPFTPRIQINGVFLKHDFKFSRRIIRPYRGFLSTHSFIRNGKLALFQLLSNKFVDNQCGQGVAVLLLQKFQ